MNTEMRELTIDELNQVTGASYYNPHQTDASVAAAGAIGCGVLVGGAVGIVILGAVVLGMGIAELVTK